MTNQKLRHTEKFGDFTHDLMHHLFFGMDGKNYKSTGAGFLGNNSFQSSFKLGTKEIQLVAIEDNDREFFLNVLEFNKKRNAKKEKIKEETI
mgnify:CR=1 FL=1